MLSSFAHLGSFFTSSGSRLGYGKRCRGDWMAEVAPPPRGAMQPQGRYPNFLFRRLGPRCVRLESRAATSGRVKSRTCCNATCVRATNVHVQTCLLISRHTYWGKCEWLADRARRRHRPWLTLHRDIHDAGNFWQDTTFNPGSPLGQR